MNISSLMKAKMTQMSSLPWLVLSKLKELIMVAIVTVDTEDTVAIAGMPMGNMVAKPAGAVDMAIIGGENNHNRIGGII